MPEENRQNYLYKMHEKLRFLSALIKHGASSDRELARHLRISSNSASRRRKELEKEGFIKEYTVIPDFQKIGIEIVAFSFGSTNELLTSEQISKARKWFDGQPEVLCCLEGQGLATNFMCISVHKNYEDYLAYCKRLRAEPEIDRPIQPLQTFVVGTGKVGLVIKSFSLRNIESLILPLETQ